MFHLNGIFLLNFIILIECFDIRTIEICSDEDEFILENDGISSSIIVNFSITERDNETVPQQRSCQLLIKAPKSHLIHMQFLEHNVELHRAITHWKFIASVCPLKIIFPDNGELYWQGNFCSLNRLPYLDVLREELLLEWTLPFNKNSTKGRKIHISAIGKGEVCQDSNQHVCMTIGAERLLCIAKHLRCNGYQDCPAGSNKEDENELMCRRHSNRQSLQEIAWKLVERLEGVHNKTATSQNNKTIDFTHLLDFANVWNEMTRIESTTKPLMTIPTTISRRAESNGGASLSYDWFFFKHGVWGYLALAFFLCCSILLVCGVWEYCLRSFAYRHYNSEPSRPINTFTNCDSDALNGATAATEPPDYDDLDLPPSYTTLFPLNKCHLLTDSINLTIQETTDNDNGESSCTN